MKTLERKYSKSERIVAKAKFSSCVYFREVLLAVILGAVIGVLWGLNDKIEGIFTKQPEAIYLTDNVMRWVLLGAAIIVLLALIAEAISLNSKELIVTEDKIVFREGVLSVRNTVIPICEIRIIETEQSGLQRILGIGTVTIISDAEQPYNIKGVKSADRLTRRIMRQVADVRRESESKRIQLQLAGQPRRRNATR